MIRPRAAVIAVGLLLLVATTGFGQSPIHRAGGHHFRVVTVVDGLEIPWAMAWLPNGDMLVTERPGRLRIVRDGVLLPDAVPGVPEVFARGQGGLMDVVLHPDFASNRLVYLSYSKPVDDNSTTAVVRGRFENDRLNDVEEVFAADTRGRGHYGSRIAFDAAGYMFVSVGERQAPARGDLEAHPAQDLSNHHGVVVRLYDDGRVPEDNPFVGQEGARPEIWSYGHRNPQGLAIHPETGSIFVAEHGPQGGDEVNLVQPGKNYGWPVVGFGVNYGSGKAIHEGTRRDGMEQPIHVWVPSIATSGMMIYTGDKFPRWHGNMFVGGLSGEQLARLIMEGDDIVQEETLLRGIGRIRAVNQGPDGYIYVAIEDDGDEKTPILRLEPADEPPSAAAAATPAPALPFTANFPAEEFAARRTRVAEAVGRDAVAVVPGAPSAVGYVRFRQSNEFYYLSGIEAPHSYLLIDGGSGRSTLYLPPRDERRESSEGKLLSADDAALVMELTGVDEVKRPDALEDDLRRYARQSPPPSLYTPFEPAEIASTSRDLGRRANSDVKADPWDGRLSREQHFVGLLNERLPALEVEDLSPTLDRLRLVKSAREIALIRRATDLSGLAIMEAMRSTEPGVVEYELDGLAKFIFYRNGAQADAYYSLIASGTNAWNAHYHAGADQLEDGELLLMDYAPDVGYYVADVTRQWPVNGTFNGWQRELYGFYLAYYKAILDNIRPGDVQAIKQDALAEMRRILERWEFSKPHYRAAAERFVEAYARSAERTGGSLGHGVGMAVHDVGRGDGVLVPGMVFTIEPQFRVPEEQIYIRLEDMVLITEDGAENMSGFVPMDIPGIEAVIAEEGLLQRYPKAPWGH